MVADVLRHFQKLLLAVLSEGASAGITVDDFTWWDAKLGTPCEARLEDVLHRTKQGSWIGVKARRALLGGRGLALGVVLVGSCYECLRGRVQGDSL